MGKQGPCYHCGITTTPLWRNGPADKPVLCNACGSRWRTKGTLVNYMPMHCGGIGLKVTSAKKSQHKLNECHSYKRKEPCEGFSDFDGTDQHSDLSASPVLEEDVSTRSSMGSGVSGSGRYTGRFLMEAKTIEFWPPWGSYVPSKRRTVIHRHQSSTKRFSYARPLLSPSICKYSPDEVLLDCKPSMEIGLGGVLITPPVSTKDSQLTDDFKDVNHSLTGEISPGVDLSEASTQEKEDKKSKQLTRWTGTNCTSPTKNTFSNKTLLESFPYNKRDVVRSCHSPLIFVELKDIINFDTFSFLLTDQEQEQLVKYLSSAELNTESLRSMFSSAQFESALKGFQALLSTGMFDSSESGLNPRVVQHYQELLMVPDLTGSGWIKRCSELTNNRSRRKIVMDSQKIIQVKEDVKERMKALGLEMIACSNGPANNMNKLESGDSGPVIEEVICQRDDQLAESTTERYISSSDSKRNGAMYPHYRNKLPTNVRCLFPSGQARKITYEAPSYSILEQDILLDLPSTCNFQQAELLHKPIDVKHSKIGSPPHNHNSNKYIQNTWQNETNVVISELWNSPSSGSVNDNV